MLLHLFAGLLVAEQVLQGLACDLGQRGHRRGKLRGLGVGHRDIGPRHGVAVGVLHGVEEQVRVALGRVVRPHRDVTGHLLGRQNGLFHVEPARHVGQPGHEAVGQALGVLGQADVAHAALDAVHDPALTVKRDDRNHAARHQTAVLQHLAAAHQVLAALLALDLLAAGLGVAGRGQLFGQGRVFLQLLLGVLHLIAHEAGEPNHRFLDFLDAVQLADPDDIRRTPVVFRRVDIARPGGGRVVPLLLIFGARHRREHIAALRVGLVLALGAQVVEHRHVSVEDGFEGNGLPVVLVVVLVLVAGPHAPGTHAARSAFFESVVVGLICRAAALVGPQHPVAGIGELVARVAVLALEIDGHAVGAVLVDNPDDGQMNPVELKPGLVLELLAQRAFPLRASDRVKPTILIALPALVALGCLDVVEFLKRFLVDLLQALFCAESGHVISPAWGLMSCWRLDISARPAGRGHGL